jgi:hypothetical protein
MTYAQPYSNSAMAASQPEGNADANIQEALAWKFDHQESIDLSPKEEQPDPGDSERTIDMIRTMLD